MKQLLISISILCSFIVSAQQGAPPNGVADRRHALFALKDAIIHTGNGEELLSAIMLVQDEKILGFSATVPLNAVQIDCKGKHIYPAFIDVSTSYGMPESSDKKAPSNLTERPDHGAKHWNMVHSFPTRRSSDHRKSVV